MPLNLEEIIPEDDSVRLLSLILDELDYGELNRAYSALGRKAAIEPRIMLPLWYLQQPEAGKRMPKGRELSVAAGGT